VLSGSGDIALAVNPLAGGNTASESLWFGLLVALVLLIVVGTMFVTVEYRRGLIRTTFTATPQRGVVLAAKVVVIAAIAFAVGALAATVGGPLGVHILNANGNFVFPATSLSKVQIVAGSGALLALTSIAVLALGTILRTSAAAITTGIVVFVLPYIVSTSSAGAFGTWLFRLSPGRRLLRPRGSPPISARQRSVHHEQRLLPARPLGRSRRLVRLHALALGIAALLLRRRDA
jgi:hypothetical protein